MRKLIFVLIAVVTFFYSNAQQDNKEVKPNYWHQSFLPQNSKRWYFLPV